MCNTCLCPWQLFAPVGRISSNATMETASWAADSVIASETVQTDQTRQTVETVSVACWCECSQTYHLSAFFVVFAFVFLFGGRGLFCNMQVSISTSWGAPEVPTVFNFKAALGMHIFQGFFCNSQPQVVLLVSSNESCHSPDLWQFHFCVLILKMYIRWKNKHVIILFCWFCSSVVLETDVITFVM